MTLNEIAQTVTPTGYAAAIIGLLLCLVAIVLRSRSRNLADEAAYHAAASDGEYGDSRSVEEPAAPPPEPDKPKTAFKAYVPGESDSE